MTITSDSAKLLSKMQRKEARKERTKRGQGVVFLLLLRRRRSALAVAVKAL